MEDDVESKEMKLERRSSDLTLNEDTRVITELGTGPDQGLLRTTEAMATDKGLVGDGPVNMYTSHCDMKSCPFPDVIVSSHQA